GVRPVRAVPSRSAAHDRTGTEQVRAARTVDRPSGLALLARLVPGGTALRGRDDTVAARAGRLAASGRPVVGVALAADRAGKPTPDGYRLLTRAARLAGRLGLPLVTLVDTPGADPSPAAEADGQAGAIGEAMAAVLGCPTATVGVLTGEGGSGGALAAVCTDVLLAGPDSYCTALVPEGAAATLRLDVTQVADRSGLRPRDLIALGLVDGETPAPCSAAFDALLAAVVEDEWSRTCDERLARRNNRWSEGLTGRVPG
ncbi:MAG TPA: carboxyl transferase domain-containing protein, partial [Frankiaceae bacterium]|nr:carboxyl transferase domain-containing protein [Frankiaceae bacterium]